MLCSLSSPGSRISAHARAHSNLLHFAFSCSFYLNSPVFCNSQPSSVYPTKALVFPVQTDKRIVDELFSPIVGNGVLRL